MMNRRQALVALSGLAMANEASAAWSQSRNCDDLENSYKLTDPVSRRGQLYELLGDLPDRNRSIDSKTVATESHDGYVLQTLELELNGIEKVPAYFVTPEKITGKVPTILFNHSHGGGHHIGKKEFIRGRSYLYRTPYAKEITSRGWAGLCIDHWVFGERNHTSESDMFKSMLWQGQVLWGMMVYDSIRALDYLVGRPEVDAGRLGTLGMSMGSTMAWWLAALDERIKVTVDICCLTDFHTLLNRGDQRKHGIYYYVPKLLKYFTTAQINALIAPRAHLALAGTRDRLTPVEGLDIIEAELNDTYRRLGASEKWKLLRYDTGHKETREGRQEALAFLERFL